MPATEGQPSEGTYTGPGAGSWATWQLVALDTEDGRRQSRPPYLELDLHPTGQAFFWGCSLAESGDGERCPFLERSSCRVGTVSAEATAWHVRLANDDGTSIGEGDIVEEASGDIYVDGKGVLPARAHYHRVAYTSPEGCAP